MSNKLLTSVGYLPNIVEFSDFYLFADLLSGKFSRSEEPVLDGFEYVYTVDQDPDKIIASPIAGRIKGVHGPWTRMGKFNGIHPKLIAAIFFKPKVAESAPEGIDKTIDLAAKVGAQYIVIHASELEFESCVEEVKEILKKCADKKIQLFLENEGKNGLEGIFQKPISNLPTWLWDPVALFEKFHVPIVFDPATIEDHGQDINKNWEALEKISKGDINSVVGHVHLNEFIPHIDSDHGVLKSEHYATLLHQIAKSGYDGYFTFEVTSVQSHFDKYLAIIYAGLGLFKITKLFPQLTRWYGKISQQNIYDSIVFTQKNLVPTS